MKEISDEQLMEWIEEQSPELDQAVKENPDLQTRVDQLKEMLNIIAESSRVEVPEHIGMNIQDAIREEQDKRTNQFSWMQVAAAITILVVGFGIGKYSGNGNSNEIAQLRNEIASLKEVTLTSALQNYSASERIMAVNQIQSNAQQFNPELIATLVNTLNSDDSPNVRYAALQALANYIDSAEVRAELVKSLESQQDALIQISLISILVEAEERSAIAPLKDILDDDEQSPEVKQQAEIAIQVLT